MHHDGVLLRGLSIQNTLHMSVCSKSFLDVAPPSVLSSQFHRFEPLDVLPVEEHEPDGADLLASDLESVSGEDGSLDYNSVGIVVEETSSGQQGQFTVTLFLPNIIDQTCLLTDLLTTY